MSNTNSNSISSIKPIKNQNNNIFNTKIASFQQKTYLKEYAINQKMYPNKKNKKKNSEKNIELTYHKNNDKEINGIFPIDLLNKSNAKYYNKNKNNYMSNNYINNNKNMNSAINSTNQNINIHKKSKNKTKVNKSNIIYYNHKNKNQVVSFSKTGINNSVSYNYNNKSKIDKIKLGINHVNTHIIDELNVSEKNYINSGLTTKKFKNLYNNSGKELESEINKLKKEKEENKNLIKKQKKIIEKFEEDNDNLENRINSIIYENKEIKEKIETFKENQEQLILLIKIVQKSGIDVEALIDKWNNDVDKINEENETSDNKESTSDEINELNCKIDPSSFIPINIEEPHVNKKVFKGIPKLNFSSINNKENTKSKYKNSK